jgi:hypothetical protein
VKRQQHCHLRSNQTACLTTPVRIWQALLAPTLPAVLMTAQGSGCWYWLQHRAKCIVMFKLLRKLRWAACKWRSLGSSQVIVYSLLAKHRVVADEPCMVVCAAVLAGAAAYAWQVLLLVETLFLRPS